MSKHETALTDGQMAEFVSAGTKALILIANEQLVEFCVNHRDKLSGGGVTFFLLKKSDRFFVACARVGDSGRLRMHLFDFRFGSAWDTYVRHRVVVPRLC